MSTQDTGISRRKVLVVAAGLAAALVWLGRPFARAVAAGQVAADITAERVARAPTEPDDPQWSRTNRALVSLSPQNLVVPRVKEAGAKRIDVRALYDDERLALLLEWNDAHEDVDLGTVLQYRDAVAIQFPEDPTLGLPSYTMGQQGKPVTIYHWKSDWQFGRLRDVDEAYPNMYGDWYPYSGKQAGEIPEATDYLSRGRKEFLTAAAAGNALADPLVQEKTGPVQKMRAEGFGTVEPDETQDGAGVGLWRGGGWKIVISVPRRQSRFDFQDGAAVPIGFAVWDGSRDERNGRKAYAPWKNLTLGAAIAAAAVVPPAAREEGRGGNVLLPVLGGIGGAVAGVVALLIAIRARRRPVETEEG